MDIVSSVYSGPPSTVSVIMSCFFCCYLCVPKAMVTRRL